MVPGVGMTLGCTFDEFGRDQLTRAAQTVQDRGDHSTVNLAKVLQIEISGHGLSMPDLARWLGMATPGALVGPRGTSGCREVVVTAFKPSGLTGA